MFGPANREVSDVVGEIAGPRPAVAGLQVDLYEHNLRPEPTRDHSMASFKDRERATHGVHLEN
jgi:hypothetical protein